VAIVVPIVAELNKTGFRQTLAEFRKLETRAQRFQFVMAKATSPAGLAAIGTAATTAAYAIYGMAQAAADDQKSQTILATALRNTTGATDAQIASVEELITSMQMAAGISDTELRTGFQNLARATRDVEESQRLLALATDISVGTGRDLGSVTTALSRAYQGQFGALTRLGIPMDQNILKTKDFNAVTGILADTFGGSAANAADTYAGKMAITTEKINEAKESIGAAFIPIIESLTDLLGPAADGVARLADAFSNLKAKAADANSVLGKTLDLLNPLNFMNLSKLADGGTKLADVLGELPNPVKNLQNTINSIVGMLPPLDRGFARVGSTISTKVQTPLERFLQTLGETAAEIRSELANTFNLSAIYQEAGGKFKPFMKSFVAQARQFSQYAQNLVKLRSMGLGDVAIRQILSMDLATGSQFAADLLQQSDALKSIATINAGFAGVAALSSATGNILATPNTGGGNIYVTVTSADPNAVVDALRRYQKRNGYVPITVAA
jgi:hypothetical protein